MPWAEHVVPAELEGAAEALADDGGPEVPHVHLLRDVGAPAA